MPSSQPKALGGEVAKALRDWTYPEEDGLWGGGVIPGCILPRYGVSSIVPLRLAHQAKLNLQAPGAKMNLFSLAVSVVLLWSQ